MREIEQVPSCKENKKNQEKDRLWTRWEPEIKRVKQEGNN